MADDGLQSSIQLASSFISEAVGLHAAGRANGHGMETALTSLQASNGLNRDS